GGGAAGADVGQPARRRRPGAAGAASVVAGEPVGEGIGCEVVRWLGWGKRSAKGARVVERRILTFFAALPRGVILEGAGASARASTTQQPNHRTTQRWTSGSAPPAIRIRTGWATSIRPAPGPRRCCAITAGGSPSSS